MPIEKILITSPRITPDSTILMQTAQALGQNSLRLPSFRPIEAIQTMPIAVYGEALFAIILTTKLQHVLIEPSTDWLIQLSEHYTQRHIYKTTLGTARALTKVAFVKNADGMKAFEARVYASGSDLPSSDYYPDDYEVLVSEPVQWAVEYRCFIKERQLLTLSVYLRNGELAKSVAGQWLEIASETSAAREFCEKLLADKTVAIPPACVIDVGRLASGQWAVIEANPAYGSGIYGCEPIKVLEVVNRATLQANSVTSADQAWVKVYEIED